MEKRLMKGEKELQAATGWPHALIYRMEQMGVLRPIRVGSRKYYDDDDVEEAIRALKGGALADGLGSTTA